MENSISLIGAGATSLAFIHHYIKRYSKDHFNPRTIFVFEKSRSFGTGVAYAFDTSSNLLNTKTAFITPFEDKPSDFQNWLLSNEEYWRKHFPHFIVDPNGYAPRPLFGMYLQDRMSWLINRALEAGIKIIQIKAEVVDIKKHAMDYHIYTKCGLSLTSQYVFLLCGTLPERSKSITSVASALFTYPYPISDLSRKIPKQANVAIIGSRLSCIDSVIGLVESGHHGHIRIYSRSGYFPLVRGTQGRIVPRYLSKEKIAAMVQMKGALKLRDIIDLVRQEIALISNIDIKDLPSLTEPPLPPACIKEFLRSEIQASKLNRPWQAVLYSTNAIIEIIWNSFDNETKAEFLNEYLSVFMAYRVSIPVENAEKILKYLDQGIVSYHAGNISISSNSAGKAVISSSKSGLSAHYDFVIDAKGSPKCISKMDSALIQNLYAAGLICSNEHGGIRVRSETYEVINIDGDINSSFRAVGEITAGTYFFTSALDICARHARLCVDSFFNTMKDGEIKNSVMSIAPRIKVGEVPCLL